MLSRLNSLSRSATGFLLLLTGYCGCCHTGLCMWAIIIAWNGDCFTLTQSRNHAINDSDRDQFISYLFFALSFSFFIALQLALLFSLNWSYARAIENPTGLLCFFFGTDRCLFRCDNWIATKYIAYSPVWQARICLLNFITCTTNTIIKTQLAKKYLGQQSTRYFPYIESKKKLRKILFTNIKLIFFPHLNLFLSCGECEWPSWREREGKRNKQDNKCAA